MSDFLLDFRPALVRKLGKSGDLLRFSEHCRGSTIERPEFGLVLTLTGNEGLWEPYTSSEGVVIAIAGRLGLDEAQWRMGETISGPGGLAAKALYALYRRDGLSALENLGGNCVILVFDPGTSNFHILTDITGAFPAYELTFAPGGVYCSHPDVLAAITDQESALDDVSMAEFLMTSTVTPPYTYYRNIRCMETGTMTTVPLPMEPGAKISRRQFFAMSFQPDHGASEAELAEELAQAFRNSVRRRTLSRLGRTAVALSGGLDSRAILACIENKDQTFAFTCYNEANRELKIAEAIAGSIGVAFHPWQRDFEYYGRTAELGVKISAGMGTFANNHFLGIIPNLRAEGVDNLLTGCYCDYLFKGLPLNRRSAPLTGREQLAPFRHEFYFSHHSRQSPLAAQMRERWQGRVPVEFQAQDSPSAVFQVEARRTFPLCYEGDNQQRLVPQRMTGWNLPVADRDIMTVYRRIPWHYKLNRSVFLKAIAQICQGPVARIPDANTGAPIGASSLVEFISSNWLRLERRMSRAKKSIATEGSWPNWHYYVSHSTVLRDLWRRPNAQAEDSFRSLLSPSDIRRETTDYQGEDTFLLVSLLTLKLWFDQWHQ